MLEIWALVGLLVGFVMGLTGVGAAIIGVPLFIFLADQTVREATVSSLYVVFIGSTLNWLIQRKNTRWELSIAFSALGWIGSTLSAPLKTLSPDWVIKTFFAVVVSYSLFTLWKPRRPVKGTRNFFRQRKNWPRVLGVGLGIGVLITMTGLGGGVILMPFLLGVLKLPGHVAVPTSLLTLLLNASGSIVNQLPAIRASFDWRNVLAVGVTCWISAQILKLLMHRINSESLGKIRRYVLTVLILTAVGVVLHSG